MRNMFISRALRYHITTTQSHPSKIFCDYEVPVSFQGMAAPESDCGSQTLSCLLNCSLLPPSGVSSTSALRIHRVTRSPTLWERWLGEWSKAYWSPGIWGSFLIAARRAGVYQVVKPFLSRVLGQSSNQGYVWKDLGDFPQVVVRIF